MKADELQKDFSSLALGFIVSEGPLCQSLSALAGHFGTIHEPDCPMGHPWDTTTLNNSFLIHAGGHRHLIRYCRHHFLSTRNLSDFCLRASFTYSLSFGLCISFHPIKRSPSSPSLPSGSQTFLIEAHLGGVKGSKTHVLQSLLLLKEFPESNELLLFKYIVCRSCEYLF